MRGLILGKFLPYHEGHAHLIRSARSQVEALTVLVCSIASEPIPGGARFQWVRQANPDCRVVHVSEEVPQAPEEDPRFWEIWTALIERHAGEVDVVFTSESYGDELARRLDAKHVCVDLVRRAIPVSGTEIRNDPMGQWQYIPRIVRPWYARRVALMGPESTGKTTMAEQLSARFATAWVPEYGREYCATLDARALRPVDFEAIAWGQATLEDAAAERANRVLICDTELLTTCTWSDIVTHGRPRWLTDAARARHYDLTFLLDCDVPWVDDGTRVLRDERASHFERLFEELSLAKRGFLVINGSFDQRLQAMTSAITALINT
ncbi:MAG: Transcriptional regulator [Gemmatimonadetes bacterium]|nr:Transcriptional regulator [Gemmatimonadota bacterium]